MPVTLNWQEIAIRLILSVIAGLVIGFNRGEHGRPAGMRTTLLVCLAASLSMIQANLLMNTVGKAHDSFVVLDLMRLPLGILSGMGFIGAGAILRRNNLVLGVTTAATLWFTTVMGLCFGGGQLGLGIAALVIGFGTLWGLKYVERIIKHDVRALLVLTVQKDGPSDEEVRARIAEEQCTIVTWGITYFDDGRRQIRSDIERRIVPEETNPPGFISRLGQDPGVENLRWQPQGLSDDSNMQPLPPKGMAASISEPRK